MQRQGKGDIFMSPAISINDHIHIFKRTGGGCSTAWKDTQCDDKYECGCGMKFTILSSSEVHYILPEEIWLDKNGRIQDVSN